MHEQIKIKIELIAEFWDRFPMIDMVINGDWISQHIIDQRCHTIENTVNLQMGQSHLLQLHRYNKSDDQCQIIDGRKKDQYVIINDVIIDGINVQNLIENQCWYEPEYPEVWARQQKNTGIDLESKVIGETWLSHNGIWNFEFSSPFYKFVIKQFKQ
jgi:hypothetical protein